MSKKYSELNPMERDEFAKMLWSWLEGYTDEVISRVLRKVDDILANDMAMAMLEELHARKTREKEKHIDGLRLAMDTMNNVREFKPDDDLSHCGFKRFTVLTHAESYGDVLSDWFIRPEEMFANKKKEEK